jgi:hypothetical protein
MIAHFVFPCVIENIKGARIMTLDQVEGNEPIHENWGNPTGDDIDEVSYSYIFFACA